MTTLRSIIIADRPDRPRPAARRRVRRSQLSQNCSPRRDDLEPLPPPGRQPLRARPGPVLPYALHRYHLPARPELPAGGRVPFAGARAAARPPLRRGGPPAARAEQAADGPTDALSSGARRRLPGPRVPDAGRPGPPERPRRVRATGGCSASATRPTTRSASAPSCSPRSGAGGPFPVLRERTPGADGPVALVLERHLLPRDGLPRGGPRPERVDRPRRPRPGRSAAAADRGLPAGDRRAGPAAGQRRPRLRRPT